jgi:hypothetical protein
MKIRVVRLNLLVIQIVTGVDNCRIGDPLLDIVF